MISSLKKIEQDKGIESIRVRKRVTTAIFWKDSQVRPHISSETAQRCRRKCIPGNGKMKIMTWRWAWGWCDWEKGRLTGLVLRLRSGESKGMELCVGFVWGSWTMVWGWDFNCKEKPLEGSDTNGQRGVWGEVKGKLLQWSRWVRRVVGPRSWLWWEVRGAFVNPFSIELMGLPGGLNKQSEAAVGLNNRWMVVPFTANSGEEVDLTRKVEGFRQLVG